MTPYEELFALAERLKKAADRADSEDVVKPIIALEEAGKRSDAHFPALGRDITPACITRAFHLRPPERTSARSGV